VPQTVINSNVYIATWYKFYLSLLSFRNPNHFLIDVYFSSIERLKKEMSFNISRRIVFDVWLKNEKNEYYDAVIKFILQLIKHNNIHFNRLKVFFSICSIYRKFERAKSQMREEHF